MNDATDTIEDPGPGLHDGIPAEAYHALPHVSSSALKKIITHSPAHAKALIDEPGGKSSAALEFGDRCHAAILQPDRFDAEYVVAGQCEAVTGKGERCDAPGKARVDGQWRCGRHGAKQPEPNACTEADHARLVGIRRACWSHPQVGPLLRAATRVEATVVWDDPATGLRCKARPDVLCDRIGVMPDLKTARSAKPSAFGRQAFELGYHVQLAHYLAGLAAVGSGVEAACLVAVEAEPPYAVTLIELDDELVALGDERRREALDEYARCRRAGDWPAYGSGTIGVPAWARRGE